MSYTEPDGLQSISMPDTSDQQYQIVKDGVVGFVGPYIECVAWYCWRYHNTPIAQSGWDIQLVKPPYPSKGKCQMNYLKTCWSMSFCRIYGCAKHPSNEAERQQQAEDEDRRLGYTK